MCGVVKISFGNGVSRLPPSLPSRTWAIPLLTYKAATSDLKHEPNRAPRLLTFTLNSDSPMNTFLKSSPTTSSLQGPPHLLALHYLQTCLKRHDSSQTNFKYTATVADTFFELNGDMRAGWKMPDWLVSAEMARDPERWIARGLRWGWISEAVEWSLNLISKVCRLFTF